MEWAVEYADEFENWWESLDEDEQESVTSCVLLLEARRVAILLIGGDKTGTDRWYEKYVPLADKFYDTHIDSLKEESK